MLGPEFDISKLRAVPLFAPLSDEALELLRPVVTVCEARVGDILIAEGDPPTELYVLIAGECKVVKSHRTPHERVMATLQPGESFGVMALVSGEPRSATVMAVDHCHLLALGKPALDHILLQHPQICVMLLRDAYRRIRAMLGRVPGI